MFSSLSSFSLSHLLSPLFKPKHHPPPNINITHHSGGNIDLGFFFFLFFFPFCCDAVILADDGLIWVDKRWWKRWSSGGSGGVDLAAAVSRFWSRLIWVFFLFSSCCDAVILTNDGLIWVNQQWRKRWSSGGDGSVDLTAAVSKFWSRLIWVFFFFF